MRAIRLVAAIVCVLAAFEAALDACDWDYPIWPKDKRSDTPLFRFVVNGKKGFINELGKTVIPAQFLSYGNNNFDDFFEGISGRDSAIDSTGRPVSFSPLAIAGHFSEGLVGIASSREKNARFGFADHQGKLIIPSIFDEVKGFSDRHAAVKVGGLWGYIDHAGKMEIEPRFYLAEPFSEGAARVVERAPCNYTGHDPCDFFNPEILGFPDRKSGTDKRYPACQYSFIGRSGVPLFPQTFPDAYDFSEGLAPANDGKLWGYIDKTGAFRIKPQFVLARPFSEGLAAVLQDHKWGFIDQSGHFALEPQFDQVGEFSSGAAVVGKQYTKVWFIDKSGKTLFDKEFTAAGDFRLGLAHVRTGQEFAYINRSGTVVFRYRDGSQRALEIPPQAKNP